MIFHALGREQLGGIVEIQLGNLRKRLAARWISLGVTAAATAASRARATTRSSARGSSSA